MSTLDLRVRDKRDCTYAEIDYMVAQLRAKMEALNTHFGGNLRVTFEDATDVPADATEYPPMIFITFNPPKPKPIPRYEQDDDFPF